MEEQELKNIWQRSSKKEEIIVHMEQLITDFKAGMEKRERIVRNRDFKEIIGSVLGIIGFTYIAIEFPFSIATVGIIVIIGSLMYSIYKLRAHRKSKYTQSLFLPIAQQLSHQKQFMTHQARLLETVLYWMILPLFSGYMLFIWSIWKVESYDLSTTMAAIYPDNLKSKILYTLIAAIYCSYIVWMNKKAAKENWEPLIKKIDSLIGHLKK